jgi:hypothetical protein
MLAKVIFNSQRPSRRGWNENSSVLAISHGCSSPVAIWSKLVILVAGLDSMDETSVGWDTE